MWSVKRPSCWISLILLAGCSLATPRSAEVVAPEDGRATFEVRANGTVTLELHEVQRSWSWGWSGSQPTLQPIPGGKVWKATFDVK